MSAAWKVEVCRRPGPRDVDRGAVLRGTAAPRVAVLLAFAEDFSRTGLPLWRVHRTRGSARAEQPQPVSA